MPIHRTGRETERLRLILKFSHHFKNILEHCQSVLKFTEKVLGENRTLRTHDK